MLRRYCAITGAERSAWNYIVLWTTWILATKKFCMIRSYHWDPHRRSAEVEERRPRVSWATSPPRQCLRNSASNISSFPILGRSEQASRCRFRFRWLGVSCAEWPPWERTEHNRGTQEPRFFWNPNAISIWPRKGHTCPVADFYTHAPEVWKKTDVPKTKDGFFLCFYLFFFVLIFFWQKINSSWLLYNN